MASNHHASGQYDQALLADAPAATKEMIQQGYSADLLNSSQRSPVQNLDVENGSGVPSKENLSAQLQSPYAAPSHPNPNQQRALPFWRTTKGIIIAVVVLVVIAAVIGGAVGGTRHHNPSVQDVAQQASGTFTEGQGSASQTSVFTTTITTSVASTEAGGTVTSILTTITSTVTPAVNGVGGGGVGVSSTTTVSGSSSSPPAATSPSGGGAVTVR